MVNFGLNSASILGIALAAAGASLYFLRSVRPELSRDHDIFFAAVGLLCGFILLFQGWRLEPILQFGQFLLSGSAVFFAIESIRLRGLVTEQARRNTPIVDDDRPVSLVYRAELDQIEPYGDTEERYERRLRGYENEAPHGNSRPSRTRPNGNDYSDCPNNNPENQKEYYEMLDNEEGLKIYREALEKSDANLFFRAGEAYDKSYKSCYGDVVFSGSDENFFRSLSHSFAMDIDLIKSAFNRDEMQKSLVFSCHCYIRTLKLNPDHYMANLKLATALTAALRFNEAQCFWIKSLQLKQEETVSALVSDASGPGLKAFATRVIMEAIQNKTIITEDIIKNEFVRFSNQANLFYLLSEKVTPEDAVEKINISDKQFQVDKYLLREINNVIAKNI